MKNRRDKMENLRWKIKHHPKIDGYRLALNAETDAISLEKNQVGKRETESIIKRFLREVFNK